MAKVESFDASNCGLRLRKMFGHGNARLPVGNMPMMDRINHISDEGGEFGKGDIIAELDIHRTVVL